MTCVICGRQEPRDSPEAKLWRTIMTGRGGPYHVCPLELPSGGPWADDYPLALNIILIAVTLLEDGTAQSPIRAWLRARRTGAVPRYSYDAFLEYLPMFLGCSLN